MLCNAECQPEKEQISTNQERTVVISVAVKFLTRQMRPDVLGPKIFFVTGLVIFATAVARLVCPDLLG